MADARDSTTYALYVALDYPTVGLPNRDYYLANDSALAAVQQTYLDTGAALLKAAGYPPEGAAAAAEAIYDFEQRLMAAMLTREQKR
jgi:putative endopeptidase